jgi:hypothetical protein
MDDSQSYINDNYLGLVYYLVVILYKYGLFVAGVLVSRIKYLNGRRCES